MRLWFNVCGMPAVVAVIGFLLSYVAGEASLNRYVSDLSLYLLYASQAAFVVGLLWCLYNLFRVVRAYRGKGERCFGCGHPVTYKRGKYGLHFHCWGCASNRAERS
jgi:hypothetical protein